MRRRCRTPLASAQAAGATIVESLALVGAWRSSAVDKAAKTHHSFPTRAACQTLVSRVPVAVLACPRGQHPATATTACSAPRCRPWRTPCSGRGSGRRSWRPISENSARQAKLLSKRGSVWSRLSTRTRRPCGVTCIKCERAGAHHRQAEAHSTADSRLGITPDHLRHVQRG